MRDNNAGDTANHDNAATPNATLIQRCEKCGSHFAQDHEERLCWNCIAWGELWARNSDQARSVRGSRGGRRP